MDLPLHPQCSLLQRHECGLIAVDKACGVLSHPNRGEASATALLPWSYDPAEEVYRGKDQSFFILNRLDSPTSGICLLADNATTARLVKDAFARHVVEKDYIALVKGVPQRKQEEWRDCLEVKRARNGLRTAATRGRPNAFCSMQLRRIANGPPARALLVLTPTTGRTHQLRVQCASRRLPIVGDATYGDFSFNREFKRRFGESRLFLHSWRTRLSLKLENGKMLRFSAESPLPSAFTVALA